MSANKTGTTVNPGEPKKPIFHLLPLNGMQVVQIVLVKFGNDQVAKIMGFGDYQIGNVYYIQGFITIEDLFKKSFL
ncbi:hypothetical protein Tco_0007858 [Tanacetum coccineum]